MLDAKKSEPTLALEDILPNSSWYQNYGEINGDEYFGRFDFGNSELTISLQYLPCDNQIINDQLNRPYSGTYSIIDNSKLIIVIQDSLYTDRFTFDVLNYSDMEIDLRANSTNEDSEIFKWINCEGLQ